MEVRMVFQPFDDRLSLYDALIEALDDERLPELSVVVAWAKESGLRRIRPNLQASRARGGNARILLGIDADGARFEGLYAAIDDFNEVQVLFNAKSRTFHPILYILLVQLLWLSVINDAVRPGLGNNPRHNDPLLHSGSVPDLNVGNRFPAPEQLNIALFSAKPHLLSSQLINLNKG